MLWTTQCHTFSKINGVDEKDLIDDFLKNKERLLSGLPLRRPPTEHEDAISGEDDFEDVESENEEKPKEQPTITKPISKEQEPSKPPSSHNDDEIEGDDNFSSD